MKLSSLFFSLVALLVASSLHAANIAITPLVRHFDTSGGRAAIVTSGSGTWTAQASASWIHLEHTDYAEAGYPVPYSVDANNGVEARTGTITVSGNTHTITQDGIGARLSAELAEFAQAGGTGSVTVYAPAGNSWHVKSNVDWITVSSVAGSGTASVTFRVAAYNEISTRAGTLTIADQTFTIRQIGRRMALTTYAVSTDYFAETIKLRVNALADTEWTVTPNVDWIDVVNAGNGLGGDALSLRVAENASYQRREGTVTIGTETLTITQLGRTSLVFKLDRSEFGAAADGASGERAAVTATQDLGWSAAADVPWIEFYPGYAAGSGNGSIAYKVVANSTLYPRSGTITVTAVDSSVAPKRIEVTQEAAVATLTMDGYEFEAGGETVSVCVATGTIVGWTVVNTNSWLTIAGQPTAGPADLRLTASVNATVYPRSGVVRIADHDFTVTQKGRGVTVDYEAKLFDTDGKTSGSAGENVIRVTAENDVAWIAEADDPTWIIIYSGGSGTGNGTVKYMVAPYVGDGTIRRGTIRIGDKSVTISQRPYAASISPKADWVDGNAGAGEIQVSLDINAVWDVVLTDKSQGWIEVTVLSRDPSTGRGKVAIKYADNNTGKARSAVILIAGEEYTLTQAARQTVEVRAEVEGQGLVTGAGSYELGRDVTLTAVPNAGYAFVGWRKDGAQVSTDSVLALTKVNASVAYTAVFEPMKPQLSVEEACLAGVSLAWGNLAWATEYKVYRSTGTDFAAATCIATLVNDGTVTHRDATGTENLDYWYWLKAVGVEDETVSNGIKARRAKKSYTIAYTNLRSATHANRTSYAEGETYTPNPPSARRGYTFTGWAPGAITPQTSGNVTMRAGWLQNTYTVRYETNGAAEIPSEEMTYGFYRDLTGTVPERTGYRFLGWQANGTDLTASEFKNLTDELGGVVTIYAVWEALVGIVGDEQAEVLGNEADGFVLRPSVASVTEVIVRIPAGFDPKKVTIEVSPEVARLVANGATIKVVHGGHDITPYLNLPAALTGAVDVTKATIKPEIVQEVLDVSKGAEFALDPSNPSIKTAPTRPGLLYMLQEGTVLKSLKPGDSKIGDGQPWTPRITVKGGKAGFYTIEVTLPGSTAKEENLGGVQLWEGGPYWAECNVGAEKPEETGFYFWWGDTVGYKRNAANNGWVSVKDGSSFLFSSENCQTYGKSNSQLQSAGYIDATGNLVAAYDAATAHLGAPWRMPTDAEFAALISNCTTTWEMHNGVWGRLVTGKGAYASKSIFLSAAGYGTGSGRYRAGSSGSYWLSTPSSDSSSTAWHQSFNSSYFEQNFSLRFLGFPVRPVRGFAK